MLAMLPLGASTPPLCKQPRVYNGHMHYDCVHAVQDNDEEARSTAEPSAGPQQEQQGRSCARDGRKVNRLKQTRHKNLFVHSHACMLPRAGRPWGCARTCTCAQLHSR